MSRFKKMTAVLLSVVMFVCCFAVQAGAKGVFDNAVKITALEFYSKNFKHKGDEALYKIVLPSSGKITISVTKSNGTWGTVNGYIYNTNAEVIASTESTNVWYSKLYGGGAWEIDDLKKGTYYFKMRANYDDWHIDDFYYTFTPDEKPTISLALNVKVGDELDFSALASNYTGKVTYKTTDSKVASIEKGKVTCKKAGKAKIRAYLNNGDYAEITLVVKKK